MATAPSLFSTLASNAALWPSHDPPYADIMAALGSGTASRNEVMSGVVGLATRTPIVLAFVIHGDEDHVYVGHSPMTFPNDPVSTTPFDGRVVVLVGDDVGSAVPMVLAPEHFGRSDERLTLTHDTILGPTGHGAAPPVYQSGPHAGGTANTNNLRAHRVLVLPPQMLAIALGGKTVKMNHGHHGANHPVKEHETGKVEITSMNHGFAVDKDSLPDGVVETHVSLFDGSNCGIKVEGRDIFSVQHHPEASPGPQDSYYLFERFAAAL